MEESWGRPYTPRIEIEFQEVGGRTMLHVRDNGEGMDEYIIEAYYSKVASSYYRSAEFHERQAKHSITFRPISRFGIGRLSCFLVADSISLDTLRLLDQHKSSSPIKVCVESLNGVFCFYHSEKNDVGTSVTLAMKPDNPWARQNDQQRVDFVRRTVPHPPFPITIKSNTLSITHIGDGFRDAPLTGWREADNVRLVEFPFDEPAEGLIGRAAIAMIESDGMPCRETSSTESFELLNEKFTLQRRLIFQGINGLMSMTEALEYVAGKFRKRASNSLVIRPQSEVALHGIAVATGIVPQEGDRISQPVRLDLPFPINLRVDVVGSRDLELNTARTHVILGDGEKWEGFVEALSFTICKHVRAAVEDDYWRALVPIWGAHSAATSAFRTGLARATN